MRRGAGEGDGPINPKTGNRDNKPSPHRIWAQPVWEQQPFETSEEAHALMVYLMMPRRERSHHQAAEMLGVGRGVVSKLSARFDWRMRADAWDRAEDDRRRVALRESELDFRLLTKSTADRVLQLATDKLTMMSPDEIEVKDLVGLINLAVKVGREAIGIIPETKITAEVVLNVAEMDVDDQKEALRALMDELTVQREVLGIGGTNTDPDASN